MNSDKLKEIINKIDYNLKEVFESVDVKRLDDEKELTFLVKANGLKSNPKNKAEMVIKLTESGIFDNSLIWKYKTNPNEENSMLLTRTSTIATLGMDIEDIVTENRFAKEYLDTLLESINESNEVNIETEVVEENFDFEFDLDEEVIVEGIEASVMDRERLEVGDVSYNVYQLYVEGEEKPVFEYDITKK